ncbi:MAG: RluA family pseudouridine synthase [Bacteroidia bacterium]|nr:RluA family pseudouridine synthase [Bacteroidia bacterium]
MTDDVDEIGSHNEDEKELYEHHHIIVEKGQEMMRIDKYLMIRIQNATRTKLQQACDAETILVNKKPVKSSYKIKPFDEISILMANPPREIEIVAEDIPINVVYEDDFVCVVNKEPGMVVHPAYGHYTGTLVNALAYRFNNLPTSKQKLADNLEINRPGLVHRIDKNTSGIIIIAKTELAMTRLAKDFFDRNLDRKYIAIVWGDVKDDAGTINVNVARDLKNRKVMATFPNSDHGKHAITHYKVLERFGYVTVVECKLETGRTHQIRVHMKHIGHPLFNDNEYGGDKILKGQHGNKYKQFIENCFEILPRQALHAKTLGITHPITKEPIFFNSELPDDMQQVIERFRVFTSNKNV